MNFQSTRDVNAAKYSAAQVIKQGLAADGGLFVPESIPTLTFDEIEALCKVDYPTRAAKILGKFLTDYTEEELLADCRAAYAPTSFVGGAAPLVALNDSLYSRELWHGPTAAFKDMALQIMPRLLSRALVKTGEERTALILVATSGDTGKAALEGYKDIERIKIAVFYPENGVSRVQKLQMQTQTGDNVYVCAINGNNGEAVAEAIANADIMATAVGVNVLKFIIGNIVAGIRKRTLIITLPGSKKASQENILAVIDPVAHGLDMLYSEGSADCAK